jgi:hypothetical protein
MVTELEDCDEIVLEYPLDQLMGAKLSESEEDGEKIEKEFLEGVEEEMTRRTGIGN